MLWVDIPTLCHKCCWFRTKRSWQNCHQKWHCVLPWFCYSVVLINSDWHPLSLRLSSSQTCWYLIGYHRMCHRNFISGNKILGLGCVWKNENSQKYAESSARWRHYFCHIYMRCVTMTWCGSKGLSLHEVLCLINRWRMFFFYFCSSKRSSKHVWQNLSYFYVYIA